MSIPVTGERGRVARLRITLGHKNQGTSRGGLRYWTRAKIMEARLVVVVSPTFEGVARLAELISVSREAPY